jgi:hypothetical protein
VAIHRGGFAPWFDIARRARAQGFSPEYRRAWNDGSDGNISRSYAANVLTPESKVDPRENEYRIVSPVLLRGKELVFNLAGASEMSAEDDDPKNMGTAIYWPGEGRYLISLLPFKTAPSTRCCRLCRRRARHICG